MRVYKIPADTRTVMLSSSGIPNKQRVYLSFNMMGSDVVNKQISLAQ